MDYRDFLNNLVIKQLRFIIKSYNLHTKIVMVRKKKKELIEELLKHTYFKDNKVFIKDNIFLNSENIPKIITKKEKAEELKKQKQKEEELKKQKQKEEELKKQKEEELKKQKQKQKEAELKKQKEEKKKEKQK